MRDNPVKTRIAAGGHAFGAMIFEFFTPGIAQICKAAGAEFILFDMEHTAVSTETLRQQMALCRGLGIAPYVRVPAAWVLKATSFRVSEAAGIAGRATRRSGPASSLPG